MRSDTFAALAIAAIGLASSVTNMHAWAGSRQIFCVKCTEPNQTYRCEVDEPAFAQNTGAVGGPSLSLYCVQKVALEGGHGSCGVSRAAVEPCDGVLKSYTYEAAGNGAPGGLAAIQPPRSPAQTVPAPAPITAAAPATAAKPETIIPAPGTPPNQPKTLIEATDRAINASKNGIKKAGETVTDGAKSTGAGVKTVFQKTSDAVGGAAVTTWKCLSSFFNNCKSQ